MLTQDDIDAFRANFGEGDALPDADAAPPPAAAAIPGIEFAVSVARIGLGVLAGSLSLIAPAQGGGR